MNCDGVGIKDWAKYRTFNTEPFCQRPSSTTLQLSRGEVDLWRAQLCLPAWRLRELSVLLSEEEIQKADRFVFAEHRWRYIASRGLLRTVLSYYLGTEPSRLAFSFGAHGKPRLAFNEIAYKLCFNVSHSHEMALFAVSCDCAVGVDVEYLQPSLDVEQLVESAFFPEEVAQIKSLPPDQKHSAFFGAWTLKEAYLKATGEGLSALDKVKVSIPPGDAATLLTIEGDLDKVNRWTSYQLVPADGYIATLVVEEKGW